MIFLNFAKTHPFFFLAAMSLNGQSSSDWWLASAGEAQAQGTSIPGLKLGRPVTKKKQKEAEIAMRGMQSIMQFLQ